MSSIMFCIVAVLFVVHTANGLTCYKCNSKDSVNCGWGLISFTYPTENCGSVGFLDSIIGAKCYKITAESKDGREYIARGCLPPATIGCSAIASAIGWISSQSSDEGASLRSLNCDTCDTDRCNSAQTVKGATIIGMLLATVLFII
ncbi:hypothetical protein NQ318_022418 [Aromia moschata]|uniref:Protein sleepless n=1 Tax=Aromia moschata TaxID=1265417 RepID=A0AAV8Z6J1_9CUCU|nr:hypothetical protein NQ318_022418 [Aromia moschata]